MTKAEILKRIEVQVKAQKEAQVFIKELIALPSVGADANIIATLLALTNATIFDTMTTLAQILCEMLPEKAPEKAPEPRKGEHAQMCQIGSSRSCLCNSCANDRHTCCVAHGFECNVTRCLDYVKEDRDA